MPRNISNSPIVLLALPRPSCEVLILNYSFPDIQKMLDVVSTSNLGWNVINYRFHYRYLIRHSRLSTPLYRVLVLGEICSIRLMYITDGYVLFLH